MLDVALRTRRGAFVLDVSFTGPSAGLTALFGPSGCGKSSIVEAIAGLLPPDEGHIRLGAATLFDSARGIDLPLHRRGIGYVFQDARLFPHMSVRANLLYGFRRAGGERRIGFDHVVELLGVGALLQRRPANLSGGERQRVALGRALLAQPRLLLMDEPLAALDAGRKAEIMPYIELLRDDAGIPIVYVSHALDEVVRLADTVVVLAEGRVAAAGDITAVLARLDLFPPDSAYEAGALVAARVAGHEAFALTRLAFDGGELLVPRLDRPIGAGLRLRIRARDVMLALAPHSDISALNVLPAVVEDVRIAGDGCHADVRIAVGRARLVSRITQRSVERLGLVGGAQVFAVIKSVAIDGRSAGPPPHAGETLTD